MKLSQFKQQLLKEEAFKKEYERYDLAFEVSRLIIESRIVKGMTQEKLATLINTKQSSIARVESGTYLPSLSFLKKIAKAFKTKLLVSFSFIEEVKQDAKATGTSSFLTAISEKDLHLAATASFSFSSNSYFDNCNNINSY